MCSGSRFPKNFLPGKFPRNGDISLCFLSILPIKSELVTPLRNLDGEGQELGIALLDCEFQRLGTDENRVNRKGFDRIVDVLGPENLDTPQQLLHHELPVKVSFVAGNLEVAVAESGYRGTVR